MTSIPFEKRPYQATAKADKKPAIKRFYKSVTLEQHEAGFAVHLDGRILKTPAKNTLYLPNKALGALIEAEWAEAQVIDPFLMPATRTANTATDRMRTQQDAVIAELIRYGHHDLLCHRSEGPAGLLMQEKTLWDPYLAQAKQHWGLVFETVTGFDRPMENIERDAHIEQFLKSFDIFRLTAFSELVAGLGSLVLGLSFDQQLNDFEAIWQASQLEEEYQNKIWGQDAEAQARSEKRRADLVQVAGFLKACPKILPDLK